MRKTEIFFPFAIVPREKSVIVTAIYKRFIKDFYIKHTTDYYDTAIKIKLIFNMPIPKTVSKMRKHIIMASSVIYVRNYCNIDYFAKVILDSLDSVAYKDYQYISKLVIEKRYAIDGKVGTEMIISEDV